MLEILQYIRYALALLTFLSAVAVFVTVMFEEFRDALAPWKQVDDPTRVRDHAVKVGTIPLHLIIAFVLWKP